MCFWWLIIVLLILSLGSYPAYPYSRRWGYYPAGGFFIFLLILLFIWWMAWLPGWGQYRYWR